MELKDRIAAVRKAAGLTQEQLGELLGVTRQAVSKWESGQTTPDAATIAALCEKLHVSADYVLLGKEPGEGQSTGPAYEPPDTCPCCGRPVEGSICPSCGFTLPTTPPRGPRYALIAICRDYANAYAERELVRFCGLVEKQAQEVLHKGSIPTYVVLRRGLTDSAAYYLAGQLNRDFFPSMRIVEDAGEDEDTLLAKPSGMVLPPSADTSNGGGIGFLGVVLAVIVALLILSFF